MKTKQSSVDKKINPEVNGYNADSLAKLEFQQGEIEELKRQLVENAKQAEENAKQAEENAKQVNEIPKLRRQLEELRSLLSIFFAPKFAIKLNPHFHLSRNERSLLHPRFR